MMNNVCVAYTSNFKKENTYFFYKLSQSIENGSMLVDKLLRI